MLLANYRRLFKYIDSYGQAYFISTDGSQVNPGSVNSILFAICGNMGQMNYNPTNSNNQILDVGFSDTAESVNDYQWTGNVYNSSLSLVSAQKLSKGNNEILNLIAVFRNNGASNVIVKEVAYLVNTSSGVKTGLFARKVLETPVTIAPGESYSFNYILRFKS